mgnify:CR=1 FL=1
MVIACDAALNRIVLFPIILIIVIVASAFLMYYAIQFKEASKPIPTYTTTDRYLAIISLAKDVEKGVEAIRNLSFTVKVNFMLINTSWALEHWAPKESGEIPPSVLHKEMIYKLTFLTPLSFSLVSGERSFVGMFLAATAGTTIYINTDYFDPSSSGSRNVLAHELTHVLQFIHFPNIFKEDNTTDASLAKQALIEGDAGWTQHLYCVKTRLCTPSPRMGIDLRNPYIALVSFPYVYGEWFVSHLYNLSGWSIVNKAYSKPPISTSMVMHPERYVNYLVNNIKEFVEPSVSCGCSGSKVYVDRLGEYYVMLVLAQRIGLEKAGAVASGWRGDRAELYKAENSTHVTWILCWNITWASQEFSKQFYTLFVSSLGGVEGYRYEDAVAMEIVSNSKRVFVNVLNGGMWTLVKSIYVEAKQGVENS